jgi:hypothetical protein
MLRSLTGSGFAQDALFILYDLHCSPFYLRPRYRLRFAICAYAR